MTTTAINNYEDIIDSRDIIARIDDLESYDASDLDDDEREELKALKELAEEASGYAADWLYGETLIRDSYFKEYAQQLAEDIGAINSDFVLLWVTNLIAGIHGQGLKGRTVEQVRS